MSGDSKDLEDLFDSIASGISVTAAPAPAAPVPQRPSVIQQLREGGGDLDDNDELQALFDSIAATRVPKPADRGGDASEAGDSWPGQDKVFHRVGQMARHLHDTLGQLGYHELLESTVAAIPDTRDRLTYVANLTEQAACKVLNATDIANPLQEALESGSAALAAKWDALFANQIGVEDFKRLAEDTRSFLKQGLPEKTAATKAQLLEIMMAQDFQDLTGQVIKRVVDLAHLLETQLLQVLLEAAPPQVRSEHHSGLLNGPVINPEGRTDVLSNQAQVDDLLESLGF